MTGKYGGSPMRFAHTGVTQYAPENTPEAFEKAAELGYEGIELDINISGDGEIIITHNKDLGYMTFGENTGVLKEMTAEEIKKVDIPFRNALHPAEPPVPWTEHEGGKRIPCSPEDPENRVTHLMTFPEFDAWLSGVPYDLTVEVEFKDTGMLDRMDEILASSPNTSGYIFFSGERDVLEEMQKHYAQKGKPEGLRLGANIRFINDETMAFVRRSDLWEVGLNNEAFDKRDVDMLAEMGIRVFSNLGDYVSWWDRLEEAGAAGFKTNYPEAYTRHREKTKKGSSGVK